MHLYVHVHINVVLYVVFRRALPILEPLPGTRSAGACRWRGRAGHGKCR